MSARVKLSSARCSIATAILVKAPKAAVLTTEVVRTSVSIATAKSFAFARRVSIWDRIGKLARMKMNAQRTTEAASKFALIVQVRA